MIIMSISLFFFVRFLFVHFPHLKSTQVKWNQLEAMNSQLKLLFIVVLFLCLMMEIKQRGKREEILFFLCITYSNHSLIWKILFFKQSIRNTTMKKRASKPEKIVSSNLFFFIRCWLTIDSFRCRTLEKKNQLQSKLVDKHFLNTQIRFVSKWIHFFSSFSTPERPNRNFLCCLS